MEGLEGLEGLARFTRIGKDLQEGLDGLAILPPSLHCTEAAHIQCTNIVFKYSNIVNKSCAQMCTIIVFKYSNIVKKSCAQCAQIQARVEDRNEGQLTKEGGVTRRKSCNASDPTFPNFPSCLHGIDISTFPMSNSGVQCPHIVTLRIQVVEYKYVLIARKD